MSFRLCAICGEPVLGTRRHLRKYPVKDKTKAPYVSEWSVHVLCKFQIMFNQSDYEQLRFCYE